MENKIQKENDHFQFSYREDGVERTVSVTSLEFEGRIYFKCRLYGGRDVIVEDYIGDNSESGWRFINGDENELSIVLGEGIDNYYDNRINKY